MNGGDLMKKTTKSLLAILCFNILLTGCSTETDDIATNLSENYSESTYGKDEDINTLSELQLTLDSADNLEQLTFTIENKSDKDYQYSKNHFEIEGEESGKWYQLEQKKDPSKNNEVESIIKPGETIELTHDIEKYYGTLPSGHYRLIKDFTYFEHPKDWDYDTYILSCEFYID